MALEESNNKHVEIFIPESLIPDTTFENSSCQKIYELVQKSKKKSIGYFDENLTIFIIVHTDNLNNGNLNLHINYNLNDSSRFDVPKSTNGCKSSVHILKKCNWSNDYLKIYKFSFDIIPRRNLNNINLVATFEPDLEIPETVLKPFSELNLIQIGGIDLLDKDCIQENNKDKGIKDSNDKTNKSEDDEQNTANNNDSTTDDNILKGSVDLKVSSLFKMALKSYKTEKTLAWLDISQAKQLSNTGKLVQIKSIDVQCSNCDVKSCTPISFPISLNDKALLTVAYNILYDDESTIKPLVIIIESLIDGEKSITTKWTSKLDLSNNGLFNQYNNSSGNLINGNKNKLLPAAKLSKIRSYNSLVSSKNIPNLQPPRSRSANAIPRLNSTNNNNINNGNNNINNSNNNNLGGKRYSSIRLKSGSNLSLSQLWSGNTSQKFQRGLVVTISGPTRVKLGEVFRWKIQLLNKSTEKMDLILYVQSSIKKEYEKNIPPIPIQSGNRKDAVPLFTNSQLVRSFYHKFNRAGLVSLTNNLRVSLEYAHLYECELELISVERGTFNIYDFKVLDILSGDLFECNRLLDVMVI